MFQHRPRALIAVLLLATSVLAGCTGPSTEASGPATVTFTATDYAFEGPATLAPGWTTLQLENQGSELHHIQLLRIDEGKTVQELMEALQENPELPPSWATPVGGPNAANPGATAQATVDLEPGTYAMLCVIPDAQGTPHVAHGMASSFVVEGEDPHAEEPEPDVSVDLQDFAFDVQEEIAAGQTTFKVDNPGGQPHELVLVELHGNATTQEFLAAFGPNASGPPPGAFVGGITGIASGATQYFTVDLEPGRYTMICFLPDVHGEHHAPHFTKGMVHEFEIA